MGREKNRSRDPPLNYAVHFGFTFLIDFLFVIFYNFHVIVCCRSGHITNTVLMLLHFISDLIGHPHLFWRLHDQSFISLSFVFSFFGFLLRNIHFFLFYRSGLRAEGWGAEFRPMFEGNIIALHSLRTDACRRQKVTARLRHIMFNVKHSYFHAQRTYIHINIWRESKSYQETLWFQWVE